MTKEILTRDLRHSAFVINSSFGFRHSLRLRTAKVFSRKSQEKTSRRRKPTNLRSRRGLSRRFSSRRGLWRRSSGRFHSRSRRGCFRRCCCCCWRTRGFWACRGFGCLCLLLARRKERSTGQDADVFFHSVNWKSHIALTD